MISSPSNGTLEEYILRATEPAPAAPPQPVAHTLGDVMLQVEVTAKSGAAAAAVAAAAAGWPGAAGNIASIPWESATVRSPGGAGRCVDPR